MSPRDHSSSDSPRLERALDRWLDYIDAGPACDAETFLAEVDPELRPLLEPMLAAGEPAESRHAPPEIDGFRVLGELGRGGMGTVYEAIDVALERRVALKVLVSFLSASPRSLERFRREAAATARFQHPGIVEVYGIGESDGLHWISMEFVDGKNLAEGLREDGPLGILPNANRAAEIAEISAQVAEALDYAHSESVVHRDIKPHNLLISSEGRVRIVDFGLAKVLDRESLSVTGDFAGSLAYASPEQVSGNRGLDARTDIWSLGVVLYEGLTGRRPFDADTQEAIVSQILTREPTPPEGPRDLQTICLKALEKEPDRRYESAGALAADLRRFLTHEPILATTPSSLSRVMRFVRRRRGAVVMAMTLLTLLAIAGGLYWDRERQADVLDELAQTAESSLRQVERAIGQRTGSDERSIARHREKIERFVREAERILALQPDRRDLVEIVARGQERAGRLYQLLKLEPEALKAYERSVAMWEQLVSQRTSEPATPRIRLQYSSALHNRHILSRARGRDAAANRDLARAIEIWESLATSNSDDGTPQVAAQRLARALTNRARFDLAAPSAGADLARATALWTSACGEIEGAVPTAERLDTLTATAHHELQLGRLAQSRANLDRVLQASRKWGTKPSDTQTAVQAEALILRSQLARLGGDIRTALDDLERAVALREPLATGGVADHVIDLAVAKLTLASLLIVAEDDLPRAAKLLSSVRAPLEALLTRAPGLVHVQRLLAQKAALEAHHQIAVSTEPTDAATDKKVEAALIHAIAKHEEVCKQQPRPLWLADRAEIRGTYGAWLLQRRRPQEAHLQLMQATRTTAQTLQQVAHNPFLHRNLRFQYARLFAATYQLRRHDDLVARARELMQHLPTDNVSLRMSIRALDQAIAIHPPSRNARNAFGLKIAPFAVQWIETADRQGVDWRSPMFTESLRYMKHHPDLRPLLAAPKAKDKKEP